MTFSILATATAAAFGLYQADRPGHVAAPPVPATGGNAPPASIASSQPATQPATNSLRLPAVLAPFEEIDVYARVSGYVQNMNVDIGSRVHKGDELLVLDAPELLVDAEAASALVTAKQARIGAAQAKKAQAGLLVDAARAELTRHVAEHDLQKLTSGRKEDLFKGNAIPQQEVDEARGRLAIALANVRTAEARVAAAQGDLQMAEADEKVAEAEVSIARAQHDHAKLLASYTHITAAFDGVITRRYFDVGAFIKSASQGSTSPILRLTRQDKLRLRLEIPEAQSARVKVGTPVAFHVRGLEGRTFRAEVSRLSRSLRAESRTMPAEADVDNVDEVLTPGMFAQAVIELEHGGAGPR